MPKSEFVNIRQSVLFDKLEKLGATPTVLSRETGLNKTRLWRCFNCFSELRLDEYIILIKNLKSKTDFTIDQVLFFGGSVD